MVSKDFKMLKTDATEIIKELERNGPTFANLNEYINDIAIAIEATKNHWEKTTLPASAKQENDFKILQSMYKEFDRSLSTRFTKLTTSYDKFIEHYVDITRHSYTNKLTGEIYYHLLRKLNHEMFDNKDFTSIKLRRIIEEVKNWTVKTPTTYRLILKWLLYCSINKLISLYEIDFNNMLKNNKIVEFSYSCILNRDPEVIKNFSKENLGHYNKYIKFINMILDYFIPLLSEEAIPESFTMTIEPMLKEITDQIERNNDIEYIFKLTKQELSDSNINILTEKDIQNVIEKNLAMKNACTYYINIPNIYDKNNIKDENDIKDENVIIYHTIMKRVYAVKRLIIKYTCDILYNKYDILYNKNEKRYDNFTDILNTNRMLILDKKIKNVKENFNIIDKFRVSLKQLVSRLNVTSDTEEYTKLIEAWRQINEGNNFNNMMLLGTKTNKLTDKSSLKAKKIISKKINNLILRYGNKDKQFITSKSRLRDLELMEIDDSVRESYFQNYINSIKNINN